MNEPTGISFENAAPIMASTDTTIEPLDFLEFDGFHSDALFISNLLEAPPPTHEKTCGDIYGNNMNLTDLLSSSSSSRRRSSVFKVQQLINQQNASSTCTSRISFTIPINVPSTIFQNTPQESGFPSMDAIKIPEISKIIPSSPSVSAIKSDASSVHSDDNANGPRFRAFHEKKWDERLLELRAFRLKHGHALVPHTYPSNPQLARWVKRQRRQHKLMQEGKASTMTPEREELLESLGFVWDSHQAAWNEKIHDLRQFRAKHSHCLVPSSYKANPQLATWVKCQRRQYKLYWDGKSSAMTPQRISELEDMGFVWELRSSSPRNNGPAKVVSNTDFNVVEKNAPCTL